MRLSLKALLTARTIAKSLGLLGVGWKIAPYRTRELSLKIIRTVMSGGVPAAPTGQHTKALGLTFQNPIGIAAGIDKDGKYLSALAHCGFGCIEVGTVTPKPQGPNTGSVMHAMPRSEGLSMINRLGFPGEGMVAVRQRIEAECPWVMNVPSHERPIVGINIGKNRDTPMDTMHEDYVRCAEYMAPVADYITINLSSPNTAGLRDALLGTGLRDLLGDVKDRASATGTMPVILKVPPDLATPEIQAVRNAAERAGIDGICCGNTLSVKRGDKSPADQKTFVMDGGLSGAAVAETSLRALQAWDDALRDSSLALIACGGIQTPDDLASRLDTKASLVQICTGLVDRPAEWMKYIDVRPSSERNTTRSARASAA